MKISTKHKASAFFDLFPYSPRVDPSGKKCPPGFHPKPKKKILPKPTRKAHKADLTPRQWMLQQRANKARHQIHKLERYQCPECQPRRRMPKVGWCEIHHCWAVPVAKE